MRAYRLHDASWSRIVTHRVRRPEAIAGRLTSRRRPEQNVPRDGQLVLVSCNHRVDPRSGSPVDRRELLDRIIEALSIPEVDGVIASADLLEELTLLNALEHRLAFCSAPGTASAGALGGVGRGDHGVSASTIAASNFDGALLSHQWDTTGSAPASQSGGVTAEIAELAAHSLPTIVDLSLNTPSGDELASSWLDWINPVHTTASAMATGVGVWLTVPAIDGLTHLAEATGFPMLVRDTDIPVDPDAWQAFFSSELPLTIRGMVLGSSALFPIEGTVAAATARIAQSVRNRVPGEQAD